MSVTHLSPPPQVDFKISQLAVSGLRVNRLDLYGEVRAERYTTMDWSLMLWGYLYWQAPYWNSAPNHICTHARTHTLASFLGHSQILSRRCVEKLVQLRDIIWKWGYTHMYPPIHTHTHTHAHTHTPHNPCTHTHTHTPVTTHTHSFPPHTPQKYKPFKGIKYITRAGKFQVRC